MKLVILASGRGSRLNKLTSKTPKCLVKVNDRTILSYLVPSFKLFDEIIIVTGYRSNIIINELKKNITYVRNKDYMKTNMVHSLFCSSHLIDDDIIVSYSDIIFDTSIFKRLIRCKNSTLPLNYSWLNTWGKRMGKKEIVNDAEDVQVKKGKVISIGGKIDKRKFPKMQFMGLMKINKKDYFKMKKKYEKINNPKIDFTSFIDLTLKSNTVEVEYIKSNVFWTEIDSSKDLSVAQKLVKSIN
tara:strand:- start:1210 stop:1935 length:726 start_codon:yes stop_codon:yes gene_type:complete